MEMLTQKVRVLMVDDQEPPVRELKAALGAIPKSEFQFEVHWAVSVSEYQKLIRESVEQFDVLIVDLKLQSGQKDLRQGVDEVVSWHLVHSPSTIVVVYSVFTTDAADEISAAIETCVLAMRAGAADCIKKGRGSTAKLVSSVCRELRRQRDPHLVFDSQWWVDRSETLVREYGGQAIAILGRDVIASSPTIPELRAKLKESEPLSVLRSRHATSDIPRIMLVPDYEE